MRNSSSGIMVVIALGLLSTASVSQWKHEVRASHGSLQEEVILKHNGSGTNNAQETPSVENRLSPLRAGLFSLVIPGSGQLYSERYWQAAAFAVVEAGLWIYYSHNKSSGDAKTSDYRVYADQYWSVVRYADWMDENYGSAGTPLEDALKLVVEGDRNSPFPWTAVNWSLLNYCESEIAKLAVPGHPNGFTHILPVRPAQQYYELIGKYPQYGGGWNDASTFQPGGLTEADVLASNVSPNFLYYRDKRGAANTSYNNATAAAYVLVANHVFSAVEAAFGASRHNKRIQFEGRLMPVSRESGVVILTPTAFIEVAL